MLPKIPLPFDTDSNSAGITSLSPPPRRGSRRIGTPDKEKQEDEVILPPSGRTSNDGHDDDEPHASGTLLYTDNLPPSPLLSPTLNGQPLIAIYDSPDYTPSEDDHTISTAPNSPITSSPSITIPAPVRSSELRSAVSLVDVSI